MLLHWYINKTSGPPFLPPPPPLIHSFPSFPQLRVPSHPFLGLPSSPLHLSPLHHHLYLLNSYPLLPTTPYPPPTSPTHQPLPQLSYTSILFQISTTFQKISSFASLFKSLISAGILSASEFNFSFVLSFCFLVFCVVYLFWFWFW